MKKRKKLGLDFPIHLSLYAGIFFIGLSFFGNNVYNLVSGIFLVLIYFMWRLSIAIINKIRGYEVEK